MKTTSIRSQSGPTLSKASPRGVSKHPWRWSWMLSGSLHGSVLGIVLASIFMAPTPVSPPSPSIEVDGRWAVREPDSTDSEMRSADSDDRWRDVIRPHREQRSLPDPSASELSSFVQRHMEQSVADGKRRTSQENENKLSQLGRRLAETSSDRNVDAMAVFLEGLAGNRKRSDSNDDAPRPFDATTAQIDRVRKEENPAGEVRYIATLIDENGTTTDLELDAESGPQLYRTMKIIESNPLLERVYRKIVMGFLDQMLSKPTQN